MMLFIVARDQSALYASLQDEFGREPDVAVVLDRRRGERRRAPVHGVPERRQSQRRARPKVDDHLQLIGWAVVRPDRPSL